MQNVRLVKEKRPIPTAHGGELPGVGLAADSDGKDTMKVLALRVASGDEDSESSEGVFASVGDA